MKIELSLLKSNIQYNLTTSPAADPIPQLLQELSELDKCSCNIIVYVYGLSESSSSLPADRISDDFRLLSKFLKPLLGSLPFISKLFWLGRVNEKGPRPLKVILPSKEIAVNLLSNFKTALLSRDSNEPMFSLSITCDRTVPGRSHIRRVYSDLAERKNKDENNIMVRYVNGVPLVVDDRRTRSSKN